MKIYDPDWEGGRVPLDIDQVKRGIATGIDFKRAGERVAQRRKELGLTALDVARRAKISRQTLAKLEKGEPFKHSTLRKVTFVLGIYYQDLRSDRHVEEFAIMSEPGMSKWSPAFPISRYIKESTPPPESDLSDPQERMRLGSAGLQPFFTSIFGNRLAGGTLQNAGLMELHRPSWFDQHPGEECVYCLRGVVRMIVRDREFVLRTGACLVFKAFEPHKYVPDQNAQDGSPPLIFIVLAQSSEDSKHGIRTWPSSQEIVEAKARSESTAT